MKTYFALIFITLCGCVTPQVLPTFDQASISQRYSAADDYCKSAIADSGSPKKYDALYYLSLGGTLVGGLSAGGGGIVYIISAVSYSSDSRPFGAKNLSASIGIVGAAIGLLSSSLLSYAAYEQSASLMRREKFEETREVIDLFLNPPADNFSESKKRPRELAKMCSEIWNDADVETRTKLTSLIRDLAQESKENRLLYTTTRDDIRKYLEKRIGESRDAKMVEELSPLYKYLSEEDKYRLFRIAPETGPYAPEKRE